MSFARSHVKSMVDLATSTPLQDHCIAQAPFQVISSLLSVVIHDGVIFGSFSGHFSVISQSYLDHFWVIFVSFMGHF